MTNKSTKKPRNWNKAKNIVIAVLVTVILSAASAGVGFLKGIEYAEGKQLQADTRVEKAVSTLKVTGQR